ncbi:MAG TPA: type I DNA topoisomerase [Acidimicrobiales bacterium]|nr:type I DNA topoisomerase [Acidimicrobiales bacterium]
MPRSLVIVESPSKARTIAGFLGDDFVVESSIGHVRDLPRGAAEVPAAYKGEPWARLGVDPDNDFKPLYVVAKEKKSQVAKLKGLLRNAQELYLATDEDREGESIAWHLIEVLAPRVPVKRMVFHEITRSAIRRAVDEWRDIDRHLVDAQEARRILDRLYGYEVSPVLWKKVMPRLSAGRVQSVATRMLVERERARMRFRAAGWWDLEGAFDAPAAAERADGGPRSFAATLVAVDGVRLATGRDFRETGELKADSEVLRLDEAAAAELARRLSDGTFGVKSVETSPWRSRPHPPFMTSTLQQEASRKLRFGSQRTMQVAQRLYESGYITYMRTDSTTLSETALVAARQQALGLYGPDYVPDQPRRYEKKVKNAQEAHEAIRPAGETFLTPDRVAKELSGDDLRLYELIWKRTVASQMADAVGQRVQARVLGVTEAGGRTEAELAASGRVITFPGYLRAYVEGADDPDAELEDREVHLPRLEEGDALVLEGLDSRGHSTQPPSRYTEASLVKALEELGVGRPSTYAAIIGTIQDRGYVFKKGNALVPSFTAFAVVGLLERHFRDLVDYGFTATMEDDLDEIAAGQEEAVPWLRRLYFGNGRPGLRAMVSDHLDEIDAREVNSIPLGRDEEGNEIVVRVGRYGPYLQRGDERAPVAEDVAPDELTVERALELLRAPSEERELGTDPATGLAVVVKSGRFGPYVQLGEAVENGKTRPRTASLFKSMSPDTVTLDDALRLLSLPRVVGADPADGQEIVAQNGRYGPYLKKGSDTRSLASEEALLSITLEETLALFAQPKRGRGRTAQAPLKELGPDPETGRPMVVRDGRFGPYVTDGEVNASLRTGDDVDTLTPERAAELLAERRAAGPSKRRRRPAKAAKTTKRATKATAKGSATKAAAKTTAAKSGATKATAKKGSET